jgi:Tol biopolymer transport system component
VTNEALPTWSPNGRQLAFLSDVNGLWNLFVSDVDGDNPTQITEDNTMNATWSPEGYRLAYQVERPDAASGADHSNRVQSRAGTSR